MKLPDFLEEPNQGAEKVFGENAKSMIDSLLYAKLPPEHKRSVNKARLENGTYEEIVAHLERELELNALEESDDFPIATMASSSGKARNLLSNGIDTNKNNQCSYCKAENHFWKNCPKLKKKKNGSQKRPARSLNVQLTQNVPLAGKRITPHKNADEAQERTFVRKDKTPTKLKLQETGKPPLKVTKHQRPHQAKWPPKSLSQKTNFATTANM